MLNECFTQNLEAIETCDQLHQMAVVSLQGQMQLNLLHLCEAMSLRAGFMQSYDLSDS